MDTNNTLEELLILQIKRGDEKAFRLLLKRWSGKVLSYCTKLIGDKELAKDISQECWHAVAKDLHKLKNTSNFKGWIYRIAHNKSVDWIRKNQRDRSLNEQLEIEHHFAMVDVDDQTDNLKLIEEAILKLPKTQQLTLRLFYTDNLSIKQISEVMEVSVGTIKSRLFHAREHLKTILKHRNYEKD